MSWLYLFIAIACEIFGTTCLKLANGLTEKVYIIGAAIGYPLAFLFFGLSLKNIEVSLGYAVWSGVGIIGTSILGTILFRESINPTKAFFIGLIFVGVIGINLNKY
ncbi:multidrug efflux SMR transporter [Calothrix sp. UHCC 0171]|uniref:DMT family transporter n=1 Tax=Calothrix sp. UHCC 0171 TaxID=3110245 RepID=UPI002B2192D3|nr:multidrug efflux SMR transporter [Calothrix sp. UHCC 0171]MEA5571726.1 multidrug efflux SMR transporter [Calothrix sp. UHCC 0171]